MRLEEVRKMKPSELIANLFTKRDNICIIKRNLENNYIEGSRIKAELDDLLEIEEHEYNLVINEIYRRLH